MSETAGESLSFNDISIYSEDGSDYSGSKEAKLLLLGTSDSGKTTLLKQFINSHGGGFKESELEDYKSEIIQFVFENIAILFTSLNDTEVNEFRELFLPLKTFSKGYTAGELVPDEIKSFLEDFQYHDETKKATEMLKGKELPENIWQYHFVSR